MRMEMGNVTKGQEPDHRIDNSRTLRSQIVQAFHLSLIYPLCQKETDETHKSSCISFKFNTFISKFDIYEISILTRITSLYTMAVHFSRG